MADTENLGLDQSNSEGAPAETPAPENTFDLKAIQEALAQEFDKRFRGLQSMTDTKYRELQETVSQLRAANLSPEEQEQLEIKQARERAAALERENALLRLRRDHPEEVDFMENWLKSESMQDQIQLLAGFRKAPVEAAPVEETRPQSTPTPVSGNNTPRRATPSVADTGVQMTDELADQILAGADQPGILKRFFGR